MTHRTRGSRAVRWIGVTGATLHRTIADVRQKRLIFGHSFCQVLPWHFCAAFFYPSHPLKLLRVFEIARLHHFHELIGSVIRQQRRDDIVHVIHVHFKSSYEIFKNVRAVHRFFPQRLVRGCFFVLVAAENLPARRREQPQKLPDDFIQFFILFRVQFFSMILPLIPVQLFSIIFFAELIKYHRRRIITIIVVVIKQFTPERVEPTVFPPYILKRFLRALLNIFQSNVRRISRREQYRRFPSFQRSRIFRRKRFSQFRELLRQRRAIVVPSSSQPSLSVRHFFRDSLSPKTLS